MTVYVTLPKGSARSAHNQDFLKLMSDKSFEPLSARSARRKAFKLSALSALRGSFCYLSVGSLPRQSLGSVLGEGLLTEPQLTEGLLSETKTFGRFSVGSET